jgi:hypothetical protein
MLNSTMEDGGKRLFAEVVKSSAVSLLAKGVSGNSKLSASTGEKMIGRLVSSVAYGNGGNPRSFAGDDSSREDNARLGESFYLRTLRDMLLCINIEVVRCLE